MKACPLGWLAAATITPLLVSNALASALDFSDLNISGSVALSTSIGVAPFSDGEVTQSGAISTTLSGTTTNSVFSTTPGTADGINDATTILPAVNPLTGDLTASGDGVGYRTDCAPCTLPDSTSPRAMILLPSSVSIWKIPRC